MFARFIILILTVLFTCPPVVVATIAAACMNDGTPMSSEMDHACCSGTLADQKNVETSQVASCLCEDSQVAFYLDHHRILPIPRYNASPDDDILAHTAPGVPLNPVYTARLAPASPLTHPLSSLPTRALLCTYRI